jgi:hypothetical protein
MRACGKQEGFDGLGPGAALIISTAKAPREGLANPVGLDIVSAILWHPLNLRRLEGFETRRDAPIKDGYATRYSEIINCSAKKCIRSPNCYLPTSSAGVESSGAK